MYFYFQLHKLGNVMASVKKKTDVYNSHQANGATQKSNTTKKFGHMKKGEEKIEREKIVLWRRPVQTLIYFTRELNYNRITFGEKAKKYKATVIISSALLGLFYMLLHTDGPHQIVSFFEKFVNGKNFLPLNE